MAYNYNLKREMKICDNGEYRVNDITCDKLTDV